MALAKPERFWQAASRALARRINLGWWLERWTVWLMAAAIAGSVAVLLVRWMQPDQLRHVWIALAAVLGLGALIAWLVERRRFEAPDAARVRLEDALGLNARLSAAAAGVGDWPAEVEKIEWPVRWRWQRPLAVLLFTVSMFLLSAWVPISEDAAFKKRIIEKPSAVKDVEQWVQELRKEQAVEEKSAEEVDEKIADLLRRPAENWYEHGSLEAAGNLKEQTAAELRELAENLADAQRAATALQAMGDAAPQAVKDSLAAGLEQAASNLAAGGMKPNEQLLQQLQNMKPSDLKGLSKEQMKSLAEQLKKNSETLGKCLGNCQGLDTSHIPTGKLSYGKEGKNGKDGDGDPGCRRHQPRARRCGPVLQAERNQSRNEEDRSGSHAARCRSRRARRHARRDRRETRCRQERLPRSRSRAAPSRTPATAAAPSGRTRSCPRSGRS